MPRPSSRPQGCSPPRVAPPPAFAADKRLQALLQPDDGLYDRVLELLFQRLREHPCPDDDVHGWSPMQSNLFYDENVREFASRLDGHARAVLCGILAAEIPAPEAPRDWYDLVARPVFAGARRERAERLAAERAAAIAAADAIARETAEKRASINAYLGRVPRAKRPVRRALAHVPPPAKPSSSPSADAAAEVDAVSWPDAYAIVRGRRGDESQVDAFRKLCRRTAEGESHSEPRLGPVWSNRVKVGRVKHLPRRADCIRARRAVTNGT